MAQATPPAADKTKAEANNVHLVPPEERFWQRYSPHAEFPLSSAGALAIHILIFGLLGLMAWLGVVLFSHSSSSLPVEAVRLDLSGGGGNPNGSGAGANHGAPVEAGGPPQEGNTEKAPSEDIQPQKLDVNPAPLRTPQFDSVSPREIEKSDNEHSQAAQRLRSAASRIRLPDRKSSGYGKGGSGEGGGSGSGKGTGVGDGTGAGHDKLTQREKRNSRWKINFSIMNKEDYVDQIRSLGAFLAFPLQEVTDFGNYAIVRDLSKRPAHWEKGDVATLQRMNWWDDDSRSVRNVVAVLGIRLPTTPKVFLAFIPEEFERKVFDVELTYLKQNFPGNTENSIEYTEFDLLVHDGKYEPKVRTMKLKK